MFRAGQVMRFSRTVMGLPNVSAVAMATKSIHGPKPCISFVDFPPATNPLRAHAPGPNGKNVPVHKIVDELHAGLAKALTEHDAERGVLSAPMLGYNARIIVVHTGIEKQTMINPYVTLCSKQKIHAWAEEGADMIRISRHRSIAVKYTTVTGDEETWYALPLEESEVLQRHFDMFDGFSVSDRIAPVRPSSDTCELTDAVVKSEERDGSISVVPRTFFKEHLAEFMQLVEPVPRSKVFDCA